MNYQSMEIVSLFHSRKQICNMIPLPIYFSFWFSTFCNNFTLSVLLLCIVNDCSCFKTFIKSKKRKNLRYSFVGTHFRRN